MKWLPRSVSCLSPTTCLAEPLSQIVIINSSIYQCDDPHKIHRLATYVKLEIKRTWWNIKACQTLLIILQRYSFIRIILFRSLINLSLLKCLTLYFIGYLLAIGYIGKYDEQLNIEHQSVVSRIKKILGQSFSLYLLPPQWFWRHFDPFLFQVN